MGSAAPPVVAAQPAEPNPAVPLFGLIIPSPANQEPITIADLRLAINTDDQHKHSKS